MSTTTANPIWHAARRRVLAGGVAALVLSAAVGFGSGRSLVDVGGPRRLVNAGAYATDALVVFLAVALVGAALIGYVMRPARRRREDEPQQVEERRPVPWTAALATLLGLLALIAALAAAIALLPHGHSEPPPVRAAAPPPLARGHASTTTAGARAQLPPVHWRALAVAAGAVVAGGAVAAAVALRRRHTLTGAAADEPAAAGDVEALQQAVVASLDEIEREADPRRAVIKAYARMEAALAAAGVARQRAETPLEYLQRTLRLLSVTPATVGRLTRLFERARFSSHVVEHGMKDEAVASLLGLRDELEERA